MMDKDVLNTLFLRCGGYCEANLEGCTKLASDPHHKKSKARGGSDDPINIVVVCRRCHDRIHAHAFGTEKFRTHRWQPEGETEE